MDTSLILSKWKMSLTDSSSSSPIGYMEIADYEVALIGGNETTNTCGCCTGSCGTCCGAQVSCTCSCGH